MWLVDHMILKYLHQTTLPNASITRESHHVSVPSFDLLPPCQKERDSRFSTPQRCQSSGHRHIETPSGSTFLEDSIHGDGLSDTSECLYSQVLALEVAL